MRAIAQLLNLRLQDASAPAGLLALIALPGVLLPVLAAAWPVLGAARRSVRAALDDHGAADELGALSRLAARVRTGGVASTLALRNSLRRRTRLLLTLALLGSAGAMLETSLAVRAAWLDEVARAAEQRRWDIELVLQAPAPREHVLALLQSLAAVRAVEPWNGIEAARAAPDGVEVVRTYPDGGHGGFALRAAPPRTRLIAPHVVAGRWLQPDDTDAVVLNTAARAIAFGNAHLGDTVTLAVDHRPTALRLVGVIDEILTPGAAYVAPPTFARATGRGDTVSALRIALRDPGADAAGMAAIAPALARDGLALRGAISARQYAAAQGGHVAILVTALGFIAVLMAVVGLLGLAASMSVASAERTREFGVMRALGASRGVVLRIVLFEGVVTGCASWAAAIVLAWPLSAAVGRVLAAISAQGLAPRLGGSAVGILLAVLLAGATLAGLGPALRASRWSVRESLAVA